MSKDNKTEQNMAKPELTESLNAPGEKGLTPEHIGHLLKVLGDDLVNDMLESAGLAQEDLDAAIDDSREEEPAADAAPENSAGKKSPGKPRRRITLTRRFLFAAIFVGILVMIAAVNKIFMSVSINSNDPIQYSTATDEIMADEGVLIVNNVSIKIPSDGTEEYSISYSWSEEDVTYPSVPHAITVTYPDPEDAENKLYSISLYRNETISAEEVKKSGKTVTSWFADWPPVTEGDTRQAPLDTDTVSGFYISPRPQDESGIPDYNDYSYYFAVQDENNIGLYTLEGVCLDDESREDFSKIMNACIQNISIKQSAGE